jgi:hypothetical protein
LGAFEFSSGNVRISFGHLRFLRVANGALVLGIFDFLADVRWVLGIFDGLWGWIEIHERHEGVDFSVCFFVRARSSSASGGA